MHMVRHVDPQLVSAPAEHEQLFEHGRRIVQLRLLHQLRAGPVHL